MRETREEEGDRAVYSGCTNLKHWKFRHLATFRKIYRISGGFFIGISGGGGGGLEGLGRNSIFQGPTIRPGLAAYPPNLKPDPTVDENQIAPVESGWLDPYRGRHSHKPTTPLFAAATTNHHHLLLAAAAPSPPRCRRRNNHPSSSSPPPPPPVA